jgi:protein-L-isoaspartate(D-aspartate) O-methyltransferase
MERLDQAFEMIDRGSFLPADEQPMKNIDAPLSIGFGQTNSQPSTVYLMLDWLDPQPGDKVLDVGSGSGWTTALLAYLVGTTGKVYAVEKIPELVEFGANNCQKIGVTNAEFFDAGKRLGLPKFAPYDRVLVSAAANSLPEELLDQLSISGRIVIPVRNSVWIMDKIGPEEYQKKEHPGFAFVPLVG